MSLPLKHLHSLLLEMLGPRKRSTACRPHDTASHDAPSGSMYSAWLASRAIPSPDSAGKFLAPGGQRPMSHKNIKLALDISKRCSLEVFGLLWKLHPIRLLVMISLDLCRGIFPAFRGYSQALIINELQTMVSSGNFTCVRLCRLIATELCRLVLEGLVDSLATTNENIVQSSARFAMEYRQMEQRVRMDVPTLADPVVQDLFQESDLFVRSFSGVSSFGLLSPFDFLRALTLLSELLSHIWVLWSLTVGGTHVWLLIFSVASSILPLIFAWWSPHASYDYDDHRTAREARSAAKQEKMRYLAHSDPFRPEIILFGLAPWILQRWAKSRRVTLGLGSSQPSAEPTFAQALFSNINLTGLVTALQNIPVVLALQSSSASLGSFTLYRSSVQSSVFTARALVETSRMAFQGIFLMGAFCAAMEVQPQLQPKPEVAVRYRGSEKGLKIEARNVSFSYPGNKELALRNVSFKLEAGESLAIVGYNGSGKSTLANILLRIVEFKSGELLINDKDIRRYKPAEYHEHVTAVFQGFSKFQGSVKENIGVGYIPEMRSPSAIDKAINLAGADHIVCSLPNGPKTILDASGCNPVSRPSDDESVRGCPERRYHGLSGGEWQRIAISRAFMRAHRPEVDLLVLDEPTSSLDAHAQSRIFETVEQMSRSPSGERTKTVIFITHRLSTARRADKIAMMENGTITEFGTHEELLRREGSYAALYQASL